MEPLLHPPSEPVRAGTQALVAHFLARWTDDRGRWPLWTYERREGVGWCGRHGDDWGRQVQWADRIRFSGALPRAEILGEILRALRDVGGDEVGGLRLQPKPWIRLNVLASAVAHPTPRAEAGIDVNTLLAPPLDAEDRAEVGRRLQAFLFEVAPEGVPMFDRFVRAAAKPVEPTPVEEWDPGYMADALAEALGLIPALRKGGPPRPVTGVLRSLRHEATTITEAVRAYNPEREDLDALGAVLMADRGHGRYDWHWIERQRRPSEQVTLPIVVRFPFLTWSELTKVRDVENGTAEAAAQLLSGRLSHPFSIETLRRLTRTAE